jgi:chromosome segregation ATPase
MTVPVSVSGFTWTAGLVGLLNVLVGSLLVTIVRTRPTREKIANEREANLLHERADEMDGMRERMAVLEAERAVDRHRINNLTACLDALLLLLETAPERAAEHVSRIKEMRAMQMTAEAAEKGAIHAASTQTKAST